MELLHYAAPRQSGGRILLVMLPGVGIAAGDFAAHGFIKAVHQRGLPVDIVAAGADLGLYLERSVAEDIQRDIVLPARAIGHTTVWFLGISLGGMGALLHAREHFETVGGIILLAPFIGTPGLIAEAARAGGIVRWEPDEIAPNDNERKLLLWLKHGLAAGSIQPKLHLGYGRGDRFAEAHAMLARHLPRRQVMVIEGAHDWQTWTTLWQQMLDNGLFAVKNGGAVPGQRQ